jgi:hypothetical protein
VVVAPVEVGTVVLTAVMLSVRGWYVQYIQSRRCHYSSCGQAEEISMHFVHLQALVAALGAQRLPLTTISVRREELSIGRQIAAI